ncbi:MAG: gliding motility protein GldM [Bacteroidota bacterium]|jgi:gliding motility-associated protein GldM
MAGGNLSPRQRMIGMMYLVLTALLALNVSKEIINAFVTVNDSLETSNKNTTSRNERVYADFNKAMQNDAAKVGPFNEKAQKVKKFSSDMVTYIEQLKTDITIKVEGLEKGAKVPAAKDIARKDDYDVPTNLLCGDKADGRGFLATNLKVKIDEFKKNVVGSLSPADQSAFKARIDQVLNTKDPAAADVRDNKATWEMMNFYHNPVVATIALLTKFQADVRNVESEVINHLYTAIDAGSFKFDNLEARVIAPTSYVLNGQQYKADIFLAAFSSTSNPTITVGGSTIPVENGMGKYTVTASGVGEKKWGGVLRVKDPATNQDKEYPFEATYITAPPASIVSADKMNVLYIGVPNPMSISVPGIPDNNVTVSVAGGGVTLKKDGNSKYTATATTQGDANFNVTAQMDGKGVGMGTVKYRVKRIPDPVASIMNSKGGGISKSALANAPSVNAVLEGFDFDAKFKVTKFEVMVLRKGKDAIMCKPASSNLLTPEMKSAISGSGAGGKVIFENIKAQGPDGTTRSLGSLTFTLQ